MYMGLNSDAEEDEILTKNNGKAPVESTLSAETKAFNNPSTSRLEFNRFKQRLGKTRCRHVKIKTRSLLSK